MYTHKLTHNFYLFFFNLLFNYSAPPPFLASKGQLAIKKIRLPLWKVSVQDLCMDNKSK